MAAAAFPVGLADRANRVLDHAKIALEHGVQHMRNLLHRLGTSLHACVFVANLPPADGMVLVPPMDACIACSSPLVFANHSSRGSKPTVYSADGTLQNVQLFSKSCTKCRALHYMSYAVGVGTFGKIPDGEQRFYPEAAASPWWQITPSTIWSTKVLRQYEAQLLHSHTGESNSACYTFLCVCIAGASLCAVCCVYLFTASHLHAQVLKPL